MTLNKNSKPKHFIIYTFTNKINDKVYIGMTEDFERRIKRHKLARDKCSYFHRAIKKHGYDNFYVDILDDTSQSRLELQEKEIYWISYFKDHGIELYNLTAGGDGMAKGSKSSQKTKDKLKIARVGKKPNLGKKFSEDWKKKIGRPGITNPFFGKKHSEESKKSRRITERDKKLKKGEFLGVSNTKYNGYVAYIGFNGKKYSLGTFDIAEFAAAAYDRKAIELYGSDAVTNFPITNYKD